MGQIGIDEFKSHPFFAEIQWDALLSMRPPYVPEIAGETDTSNFDVDDDDARVEAHPPSLGNATFSGKDLPFVGFSFNRESRLSDCGMERLFNLTAQSKTCIDTPKELNGSSNLEEMKILEEKVRSLELEKQNTNNESSELHRVLESLKLKVATQKSEISERDESVNESSLKISSLEKNLENFTNEKNRDQIKIQHYESHERDLNLKIEYLQQELRSSEHSKNSLSDELHIVQQQQLNDQQRIITLQAKFDELSNESAFHRTKGNEVKHLQNELDGINLKLEESAQNHLFEISKTKRDYEEQINELRRKIEEERNEKEQIYRNSTNEFELLQNDHSQTQEKLNDANKELEILKQELKESQERLEAKENDKDSEKTEWEDHLRSIIQWVHDEKVC